MSARLSERHVIDEFDYLMNVISMPMQRVQLVLSLWLVNCTGVVFRPVLLFTGVIKPTMGWSKIFRSLSMRCTTFLISLVHLFFRGRLGSMCSVTRDSDYHLSHAVA